MIRRFQRESTPEMRKIASSKDPVQNLVDYLEGGETIDEFLVGFPSVRREQAVAFIEAAAEKLLASSVR
jgi:uncharacterized protein (DUF433 family)